MSSICTAGSACSKSGDPVIIMDETTTEQTAVEAVVNALTLPDEEPKPREV